MAVARVEWQCPGCERRFAIRADMQTPDLCPQCRAQTASVPQKSDPVASSVRVASRSEIPAGIPDFAPDETPRDVEPPPVFETPSVTSLRRYPALKVLSVVYKVFAVLTAVGGLVALVIAVVGAFTIEDASLRAAGILFQLGGFVASLFLAVTLYAFGELVQLLIDIEWNTRALREART